MRTVLRTSVQSPRVSPARARSWVVPQLVLLGQPAAAVGGVSGGRKRIRWPGAQAGLRPEQVSVWTLTLDPPNRIVHRGSNGGGYKNSSGGSATHTTGANPMGGFFSYQRN